ncbi:hypothetical protein ACFWQC_02980 [Nocardioides sp. NPDC058538]|uniref:hypothetical protein n=1 Tax=Nocardioides sp. NPDC058538 TaxID=3346542 RepID=UPI00365A44D7
METTYEGDGGGEIIRPVNWNLLTAEEAEGEWLDLNAWVDWLRATYGLAVAVIPPLWHRHDELIWELSALHTAWLNAYDPEAPPAAPLAWHREFAEARIRLREWVATCGTKLDRDRPTRRAAWPGDGPPASPVEQPIEHRDADFNAFVVDDLAARRQLEDEARDAAHHRALDLLDRLGGAVDRSQWRFGRDLSTDL